VTLYRHMCLRLEHTRAMPGLGMFAERLAIIIAAPAGHVRPY